MCPTARSYLQTANVSAEVVAEMATIHKTSKYQELVAQSKLSSSPLPSNLLAQWTMTPATFWLLSGGESQEPPMMTERFLFFRFSVFLFFFSFSFLFSFVI